MELRDNKVEVSELQYRLLYGLLRDCYEFQDNNADFVRYRTSLSGRIARRLRDKILLLAKRSGFVRRHFVIEEASEHLMYVLMNIDKLESLYHLLGDDYSKQLLIELLKFRILGAKHVKLTLNGKDYWNKRASIDRSFLKERHTIRPQKGWYLNRYQLKASNCPLNLHAHPLGILALFVLEQYAYLKGRRPIRARSGDIVLDGGSCWGDSAFYFADRVGADGKVYCFEFVQDNLEIFQQNINLNLQLADRIKVIPKALWSRSGEMMPCCANGPGTSLVQGNEEQPALQVPTLSIDDFVKEEKIARVDYIKMDIEGSELRALQGAENTIRAFRPRLAISLYHKQEDFVVIPDYLHKLRLRYEFFLDHFSINREETVLFANPMAN